jgi:flagellar basal-body rod modification protein FlgD
MSSISAQATLNNIQNDTTAQQYAQGQKNLGSSTLTREGFLQIIMAQMQYQDPTNPQDYSQMLGQQVQLEVADKMGSLVSATQFSQANSLIGQTVTLPDAQYDFTNGISGTATSTYDASTGTSKENTVSGTVTSVRYDSEHSKPVLEINGKYYDASSVITIGNVTASSGT